MISAGWSNARSLEELGELTARWLEGDVTTHPGGYDDPDPETVSLVPWLTQINRLGFVTDCSQPGTPRGGQRAYVSGFAEEGIASRLVEIGWTSDLITLAHGPGLDATAPIPISRSFDGPHTVANSHGAPVGLGWRGLSLECQLVLAGAWYVEVLDPSWGRNDLLWPSVVEALDRGPLLTRSPWLDADDLGHGPA